MSGPRTGVRGWGDGTGFEILPLPSKGIKSGETREHGSESLRGISWGRAIGGDGLVVGIDDKLLLVHCLATKHTHVEEASSSILELNGGLADRGNALLVLL
jgi:hypothetical protein